MVQNLIPAQTRFTLAQTLTKQRRDAKTKGKSKIDHAN